MLRGKKILLGVSGSIAAYKVAFLIRLLKKLDCNVKVVMTGDAKEFITPLTLSTLAKNPVYSDFKVNDTGEWNNHVELALWADVIVIAPATANTIAKMANGICDNLLMAVYLSAKCPVYCAPAMDLDMYLHPSTKSNLEKIRSFGNKIINPGIGELASGLDGEGRMAEPEQIIEILSNHFDQGQLLLGKKILITAGPTFESIDPVRFIGNHSSGKMGFLLAEEATRMGATVVLITGPSYQVCTEKIKRINVVSAQEMFECASVEFPESDVAILSAAVADYRPKIVATEKIKKTNASKTIELEPTVDILASLGKKKTANQILVGFALETENEEKNALTKLEKKNLDFIVLNSLKDNGAGFGFDTNKIKILDKYNNVDSFPLKSKHEVAKDIIKKLIELINA